MADDKISLQIEIEADKASLSLGELEKGFDSMKERLKDVGRGSAEFEQLSTAMAESSAEIKNIELGFEGLDRDQIASEFGGMAGGIGDVTASLVLMGGENETIEQIGASIEKAMAISMGFKGVIEGASAASKLYNSVIKTGVLQTKLQTLATKAGAIAMKFFNAVLRANPIALLVTAIVAAGAALLIFAKNTSKAAKEAKMFSDIRKEAAKSIVNETAKLEILLEVAKDETLAKEKRQEAIEELNRISPEYLSNLSLENVNTAEGARLTDLYVKSLIKASEVKAMQAKIDKLSVELLDDENKEMGKAEAAQAVLTAAIFSSDDAIKDLNKNRKKHTQTLKDERKALMDKIVQMTKEGEVAIGVAGQKSNAEIEAAKAAADAAKAADAAAKSSSAKRKAQREKDKADELKQSIDDAKALAEFEEEQARIKIQLIQDEGERKRAEIKYNSELELEALEKKGQDTFDARMLIAQKQSQALAEITKAEDEKKEAVRLAQLEFDNDLALKQAEAEKLLRDTKLQNDKDEEEIRRLAVEDEFQNKLATLQEQGLLTMELKTELLYAEEQALAAIEDEFREKKKQADIAAAQESLTASTQVIGALGDLNKMALDNDLKNAGNNDKKKEQIRKASFEREKKLNIAMALVNGAQAQMAILAQTPKADFGVATAIAMAAAAVTTIAQIAAIKKTSYQGGGSPAGGGGGSVNSSGAGSGGGGAQITPVTNTSTIIGDQQVYVTETDITSTQNQVNVIEESATF